MCVCVCVCVCVCGRIRLKGDYVCGRIGLKGWGWGVGGDREGGGMKDVAAGVGAEGQPQR